MDGFFYGAVAIICLYELVVFRGYREKSQLWFVASFLSITALVIVVRMMSGHPERLTPSDAIFSVYTFFMAATFITHSRFVRHAFAIGKVAPVLDRYFSILSFADVAWAVVTLFTYYRTNSFTYIGVSGAVLGAVHTTTLVWLVLIRRKINQTSFTLYVAGLIILAAGVWSRVSVNYVPRLNSPFFLAGMHWGVLGNAFCSMFVLRLKLTALENERLDQKEKLMQADRLSSLGIMASTIVHEISNPNAAVANDAAFLKSGLPVLFEVLNDHVPDSEKAGRTDVGTLKADLMKAVGGISCSSGRVASIVEGLRNFYRSSHDSGCGPVELRATFDSTLDLLSGETARRKVRIKAADLPEGLRVIGNAGKLEQVLVNLLSNALHAVERAKDPSVRLDVSAEDEIVKIRISDNGCGMEKEQLEKAGTVFFTTKEERGTGLGLYICRMILSECGGSLELRSQPDRGTVATIVLTRAEVETGRAAGGESHDEK